MLCLGISSVEVPFLIQIALLVDFTPKCICMVNDYRVFLDVDLICIVDATCWRFLVQGELEGLAKHWLTGVFL